MTLTFIIISLVIFFFLGVHLDGWAEGLAVLFIPEVCFSVINISGGLTRITPTPHIYTKTEFRGAIAQRCFVSVIEQATPYFKVGIRPANDLGRLTIRLSRDRPLLTL